MTKKILVIVFALCFCLSVAFILVHINDFFFSQNSEYSDIPITHYPNLLHIQDGIKNDHQIPLWSGLIQSGYPFSANPLSGLAYIWGWIAILFSLPAGINIVFILHLLCGAMGTYLFLREEGRSMVAALFGAFAFILSTKIYAHFAAGHLSLLFAIFWTPWIFYFTKKIVSGNVRIFRLLAGIVLGFIIAADPRWSIPLGLLWLPYVLKQESTLNSKYRTLTVTCITGVITSSAMWLPLLELIKYSSRSSLSITERSVYALTLSNLFAFFIPDSGGFSEWVLYPSAIVVLMVVLGLFLYKENRSIRFWYVAGGLALLLSFGSQVPILKYFFEIPGVSLLRVPSRFLFITIFTFAVISAFVYDYLISLPVRYRFDRFFFLVPVTAFVFLFTLGVYFATAKLTWTILWSIVFFFLGTVAIGLVLHHKIPARLIPLLVGILLIVDLIGVNTLNLRPVKAIDMLNDKPVLMEQLAELPVFARIYTPSYSISQDEGAFWQVNQINGIDPMQISSYVEYFEQTSGIAVDGYSVTLPPFNEGHPALDNRQYCPDTKKLAMLNVAYVIADFSLDHCRDLQAGKIVEAKYLYQLENKLDVGYFENGSSAFELIRYEPNIIQLHTSGGGRLVLREIFYPGWTATIDDLKTPVQREGIFRAIEVPPGNHDIRFVYQPALVAYGFILQFLGLLVVIILIMWEVRRGRKS